MTTLPELNTDKILDLIKWAELSEQGQLGEEYAGWGTWYQNAWGRITNRSDKRVNWKRLGEDEKQRIRNGACQTAFCMAGQTVLQEGYRLEWVNKVVSAHDGFTDAHECVKEEWTGAFDDKGKKVYRDAGEAESISVVAQRVIGLTTGERDLFFAGTNDVETLKKLANRFALNRGLPLLYPDTRVSPELAAF